MPSLSIAVGTLIADNHNCGTAEPGNDGYQV